MGRDLDRIRYVAALAAKGKGLPENVTVVRPITKIALRSVTPSRPRGSSTERPRCKVSFMNQRPGSSYDARRARLWRIAGSVSVAIGLFNAFVPLLPTTIFLILGAWAYGKGAPELRARLLAHPRFGVSLRNWLEQRAMTRMAKLRCCATIAAGYGLSLGLVGVNRISVVVGLGLAALCLYLATRAEPRDTTSSVVVVGASAPATPSVGASSEVNTPSGAVARG